MELRVLGPIEIVVEGRPLRLRKRQHRLILGILGVKANRPVSAGRLIDLMWADRPPARARAVLHSRISELRAQLTAANGGRGQDVLVTEGSGYLLRIPPQRIDMHVFKELAAAARRAASDRQLRDTLRQALRLWRGPALGGWLPAASHDVLCRGLESARLTAEEDLYEVELRLGNHKAIVDELVEISAAHPARDRLTGALMLALHRSGRGAEALEVFHQRRVWLRSELGADPGRHLRQLHVAMLRDDPALQTDETPPRGPRRPTTAAGFSSHQVVPRQLPPAVRQFTGRAAELAALTALARRSELDLDAPPVIAAIDGMAGVGKTALAVAWAHSAIEWFGDGQLYLNLRGFDPGGSPLAPAEAVRGLLDALGVPPHHVPAGLDAQVGLYRSLVAGRRILVLLDNALNTAQVRPLLPGSAGCMALITSRNRLRGLLAIEAAHPLSLSTLSTEDSRLLLAGRVGETRLAAEPDAADEIIARCAGLPLALAIVSARAAAQPGLRLSELSGQLREAGGRLDALCAGDPASDLRAVCSWSYRALDRHAARLLRLLALHPGPDLSIAAAASLAGTTPVRIQPLLAKLSAANLLIEQAGRYALHDLIRAYAAEQAGFADPAEERDAAANRMLDHYLHTAVAAVKLLNRHLEPIHLDPARHDTVPEHFADHHEALAWFATERAALIAVIDYAGTGEWHHHAWKLAWSMAPYLERRGYWHNQATTQQAALRAAERLADPMAQSRAHYHLGRACLRLGRLDKAYAHLEKALLLDRRRGDRRGQAQVHDALAEVRGRQDRHVEALHHATRALELSQAVGHRVGQARALNTVGWLRAQLGEHRQALAACGEALSLFQELDDRPGQAATWDSLGYAHHRLGDHACAITCYQHALALYRDIGDFHGEYGTLTGLGDTYRTAGDLAAARDAWQQAVTILKALHHPQAEQVRAKLANLPRPDKPRSAG